MSEPIHTEPMFTTARHTWDALYQVLVRVLPLLLPFALAVLIITIVPRSWRVGCDRRGNISRRHLSLFPFALVNARRQLWCLCASWRANWQTVRLDVFVERGKELEPRQQVLRGIKIRPRWRMFYKYGRGRRGSRRGNTHQHIDTR